MKALVTGGAGFIGSHLVDRLIEENEVIVLDDLSGGLLENIEGHKNNDRFTFIKGSITNKVDVEKALDDVDIVYHFAAQPDVKLSAKKPLLDFETNAVGSLLLLDKMREIGIKKMLFASSGGTVYGDAEVMPTPESTAFQPISNYGAAKGAFEMYLSSYSELYGIDSVALRLGNILGPRLTHGVVYDFFMKLKNNTECLEVLGKGMQEKTYLDISDTISAIVAVASSIPDGFTPINVTSELTIQVKRIAEIVIDEVGLGDAIIKYTGTSRGWAGDVIKTSLSVEKLKEFGWNATMTIEQSIRNMVQWLISEFGGVTT